MILGLALVALTLLTSHLRVNVEHLQEPDHGSFLLGQSALIDSLVNADHLAYDDITPLLGYLEDQLYLPMPPASALFTFVND